MKKKQISHKTILLNQAVYFSIIFIFYLINLYILIQKLIFHVRQVRIIILLLLLFLFFFINFILQESSC